MNKFDAEASLAAVSNSDNQKASGPLAESLRHPNEALRRLRNGELRGAAVLQIRERDDEGS